MIVSHGLYTMSNNAFGSVHAGEGNIYLGPVLEDGQLEDQRTTQKLGELFQSAKPLNVEVVDRNQLVLRQLDKLVANAIINPLTAIYGVKNGALLKPEEVPGLEKDMVRLYHEVSAILMFHIPLTIPPPDGDVMNLAYIELLQRYSYKNLKKIVEKVAAMTAENTSSMLADVEAGRKTEIDYINGYLVRLGKKYTLPTKSNESVAKRVASRLEAQPRPDNPIIPRDVRYQVAMVLKGLRKPKS